LSESDRFGADRNLLFGILALQLDFVTRNALIQAMHAWVLDKAKPLGQILIEQGALVTGRHTLLDALVQEHLKQHSNNPEKSLAALSSVGSVREQLRDLNDPVVEATLAHLTRGEAELSTIDAPSTGVSISAGGRFRIIRPHAKGGLGEVFVAQDEELHREVALKQIQNLHADNPQSRSRFVLEAEITGGLEHPGIVPVYGLGKYADGRPFYAMRFIKGDSLKDAIEHYYSAAGQAQEPGERALEFRKLLAGLWMSATPSPTPTAEAFSTATSSLATSCSASMAKLSLWTGVWQNRWAGPRRLKDKRLHCVPFRPAAHRRRSREQRWVRLPT
jgi:hypothetical protein